MVEILICSDDEQLKSKYSKIELYRPPEIKTTNLTIKTTGFSTEMQFSM